MFTIPDYLNKSVVMLLIHMMQVDPMKRATMEDIKNDEWFKKDLPAYLFPPPNESDASVVDLEAVNVVCDKFGVTDKEVRGALLSGDPHDQLAIAYHLIVDNKRIEDETAKLGGLRDFYVASSPPPPSSQSPGKHPHPERCLSEWSHPSVSPGSNQGLCTGGRQRMLSGNKDDKNKSTPIKRAKWHLGIRSQSKPSDIMNEVYRAMKTLDFEWKNINTYHVRCRSKNQVTGKYVKMSLQLYQVDTKSYLLDFKSLPSEPAPVDTSKYWQGTTLMDMKNVLCASFSSTESISSQSHNTMEFFEMCAALITQLAR
ncbi:PRKAA1 [Cordylochernes scorpioides]|uniref:non-specific serine/threonine protein kinase n=1 Tax=Cordylochernes scorpioides TaxID=51811 RepID=A0ABY6LKB9_9ARAC|nr:PRKAA1 [Cordylochernes scorpioides]